MGGHRQRAGRSNARLIFGGLGAVVGIGDLHLLLQSCRERRTYLTILTVWAQEPCLDGSELGGLGCWSDASRTAINGQGGDGKSSHAGQTQDSESAGWEVKTADGALLA